MAANAPAKRPERRVSLTRRFDAPRERVFAALGGMPEGWAQTIDRLSFCVTKT